MARRQALAEAIVEVSGPGRRAARWRSQRHLSGDAVELLAQHRRRADDNGFERLYGLASSLDRGVTDHLEVADHLDRARAELRCCGGLASQDAAGGTLGVERIVLAFLASQLTIGMVDLEHGMIVLAQEAGQASAIGAGAFDAKGANNAEEPGPSLQSLVASTVGGDGQAAEAGAKCADR